MTPTPRALSLFIALTFAVACGSDEEKTETPKASGEDTYAGKILGALDRSAIEKSRSDMVSIATAATAFSTSEGAFPDGDLQDLTSAIVPTFIKRLPQKDAWGSEFVWTCDGDSWELTAPGADGQAGTGDDIVYSDGMFTKMPDGYRDI